MEGGAATQLAFHLDLAGMLLNNAVAHGQSKARATALTLAHRRLGGEERVVNALHMFGGDARAGVGDVDRDQAVGLSGHAQGTARRHRVLRVEKQVKKDLLQFAGVAQDGRQIRLEHSFQLNLGGAELVFQQLQRVLDDVVQIESSKLRSRWCVKS